MSFMFRSVAAARSAATASVARPSVAAALPSSSFASLRFNSTFSSSTSSSATDAPAESSSSAATSSAGASRFDLSSMSHLIPTKAFEEDPDAWWRKTDHALNRNLGKPGNQYSGRSVRVGKDYNVAYNKVGSILSRTGTKDEIRRAAYYEKPSERKTRLNSERWRRRFQEMVRERVQLVQMIRARK